VRLGHDNSSTNYLRFAVQILSEHDLALPELEQLNLIDRSALEVQCLYFAACLHHPDEVELHQVFGMFVMACATSSQETEN
jgi:predicted aldo/keto reductase-like oxidoreductase